MSRERRARALDGWFRGCLAATAVLDLTILMQAKGPPISFNQIAGLCLFAVLFVPTSLMVTCLLTGLPAGLLIWFGEWLRIRSVLFYTAAGVAIGLLVRALIFGIVPPFSVAFAVAGCLAGLVYWSAAGRHAGRDAQW
ncbi:hypothetical protein IVB46_01060 [Bradyrhizobium sp. 61]|uniref:hypothetical protein n=2 Tax=Bradyrhizobium TaxID=374 RepID=UPI001FF981A2|nr:MULTISPECIES: hypothetical protein [unclassified Bradyrhizobium]MCK1273832.1 hypothetical protein [Bradyrhizobium sp. 61]MCK1440934.1 hypothetical protein [Bradyrhizobium sp. 48]MCK1459984.1 hypothetical protein [Bradyrhizobium sp. 2]